MVTRLVYEKGGGAGRALRKVAMGFRGEEFAYSSPDEAVAAMRARAACVGVEECGLAQSAGRVLAEAVRSDRDSPAFDHSAMDGYAVRLAEIAGEQLTVTGESRMGKAPPELPPGRCAVRVATGSPVPPGADCVVKREDVREDGARIALSPRWRGRTGENIRPRGENARAGDVLLEAGREVTAAAVGALAGAGCVRPRVFRRVRVAVVTTGDELVPPAQTPGAFEVRNSNAGAIRAVLASRAWTEVVEPVHVRDDPGAVAAALERSLERADAVVLSGGVSVGHRDPVREAVERVGGAIIFHGLPQRPGKPMLGAIGRDGKGIFGLPGNPVSALVTCVRMVMPVLGACAGIASRAHEPRVEITNADGKTLDLWWHRLVRLNAGGSAELVDGRGSGDLIAAGRADGFVEIPPGSAGEGSFRFFAWPGTGGACDADVQQCEDA